VIIYSQLISIRHAFQASPAIRSTKDETSDWSVNVCASRVATAMTTVAERDDCRQGHKSPPVRVQRNVKGLACGPWRVRAMPPDWASGLEYRIGTSGRSGHLGISESQCLDSHSPDFHPDKKSRVNTEVYFLCSRTTLAYPTHISSNSNTSILLRISECS